MIENFTILGRTFSAYMICALIGVFAAGIYAVHSAKKLQINDLDLLVTMLWSGLGVLLGGHILYGITNFSLIIQLLENFGEIFKKGVLLDALIMIFGGSVFYGGLICGLAVMIIFSRAKKYPTGVYTDIAASAIPLFHFFGRIGCFLSGCCYGAESSVGFVYHHSMIEMANGVSRFPVQLVEASYNLILFAVFAVLLKKEVLKGRLLYIYLLLYPVGRFVLEFFRGDDYRGFLFGFSTSQIISILLFSLSVIMLSFGGIKRRRAGNGRV